MTATSPFLDVQNVGSILIEHVLVCTQNGDLVIARGQCEGQHIAFVGGLQYLLTDHDGVRCMDTDIHRNLCCSVCRCGNVVNGVLDVEVFVNFNGIFGLVVLDGELRHGVVHCDADRAFSRHQNHITVLQGSTLGNSVALSDFAAINTDNRSLLTIGSQAAANDLICATVKQNNVLQDRTIGDGCTQQITLVVLFGNLNKAFTHALTGIQRDTADGTDGTSKGRVGSTGHDNLNGMLAFFQSHVAGIDVNNAERSMRLEDLYQLIVDVQIPSAIVFHGLTNVNGYAVFLSLGHIEGEADPVAHFTGTEHNQRRADGNGQDGVLGSICSSCAPADFTLHIILGNGGALTSHQMLEQGRDLATGTLLHGKNIHKLMILLLCRFQNQCWAITCVGNLASGHLITNEVGVQGVTKPGQGQTVTGLGFSTRYILTIDLNTVPAGSVEVPTEVAFLVGIQIINDHIVRHAVVVQHDHVTVKLVQNILLIFHAIGIGSRAQEVAVNVGIEHLLQCALALTNLRLAIDKDGRIGVFHLPCGQFGVRVILILGVTEYPQTIECQKQRVLVVVVVFLLGLVCIDNKHGIQNVPAGTQCTLSVCTQMADVGIPLIGLLQLADGGIREPNHLIIVRGKCTADCQIIGSQLVTLLAEHSHGVGIVMRCEVGVGVCGQSTVNHIEEAKNTDLQLFHVGVVQRTGIAGNTLQGVQSLNDIIDCQRVIHMAFVDTGFLHKVQTPVNIGHAHIQVLLQLIDVVLTHNDNRGKDQTGSMVHVTVTAHTGPAVVIHSFQAFFDQSRFHLGLVSRAQHIVTHIVSCHNAVYHITGQLTGPFLVAAQLNGLIIANPVFHIADIQCVLNCTGSIFCITGDRVCQRQGLYSGYHALTDCCSIGVAAAETLGRCSVLFTSREVLHLGIQRIGQLNALMADDHLSFIEIRISSFQQGFLRNGACITVSTDGFGLAELSDTLQAFLIEVQTRIFIVNDIPFALEQNRCVFCTAGSLKVHLIEADSTLTCTGNQVYSCIDCAIRCSTGDFRVVPLTGSGGCAVECCDLRAVLIEVLDTQLEATAFIIVFLSVQTIAISNTFLYGERLTLCAVRAIQFLGNIDPKCVTTFVNIIRIHVGIGNADAVLTEGSPLHRETVLVNFFKAQVPQFAGLARNDQFGQTLKEANIVELDVHLQGDIVIQEAQQNSGILCTLGCNRTGNSQL